jgi:hypothetical protein
MARRTVGVLVAAVLASVAAAGSAAATSTLTVSQVITRFKSATGGKLLVDPRMSEARRYAALSVAHSISNIGRYGRFTIWVVRSGDPSDVDSLLADAHTGVTGTPGPSNIYWESGSTLTGERYWLAKKRYGNLVLWWYASSRKIDATFQRLNRALVSITASK